MTDFHCPAALLMESPASSSSSVGVLDSSAKDDHAFTSVSIEATGVGSLEPHLHHSPSRRATVAAAAAAAAVAAHHDSAVSTFTFDTIPDMIHAAILSYPLKTAPLDAILRFAEKQALASKNEANSVLMIITLKNWETAVTNCLSLCDRFAQVGDDCWTVKSLGQQTAALVQCPSGIVEPDSTMLGKHCTSASPPPSSPVGMDHSQFESRPDSPEHHPFRVDGTKQHNSSNKANTTPYKNRQKYAAVLAMLSQQPSLDKTISACNRVLSSDSLSPSIVPTVMKMREDAQACAKMPALDLETGRFVSSHADELPSGSTVVELTSRRISSEQELQSPRSVRRAQKLSQRTAAAALALLGKRHRDNADEDNSDSDDDDDDGLECDAAFFDDDDDDEMVGACTQDNDDDDSVEQVACICKLQKRTLPARAKRGCALITSDDIFSGFGEDASDYDEDNEPEIDHDCSAAPRVRGRSRRHGSDSENNADEDDEYRPSSSSSSSSSTAGHSSRKRRKTVSSRSRSTDSATTAADENAHSEDDTHNGVPESSAPKKRAWKSGTSNRRSESKSVKNLSRGNSSIIEVRDLSPGDSDDSSSSQIGVSLISEEGSKPGHRLLQVKLKGNKRETIEVDESGQPTQALHLGTSLTIHSLGRIIQNKPAFHNDRYIFPAGFKSSRQYFSMVNPDQKVLYYSEIVNGPDAPEFKVTAEDDMEHPITSNTCTGAWTVVVRKVNEARGKKGKRMFTTVSGPEMFGLSTTLVSQLICHLPGADTCKQYRYRERKR